MAEEKREHPKVKSGLHPKNKHRERYDFKALVEKSPNLAPFVHVNKFQDESIDFSNAAAVLALNQALLKSYYNIDFWEIPEGYLCPPIPGRADYIHHVAELLSTSNDKKIPRGDQIKCLDIGVGTNCVYPIIGSQEYGWSFVGSDIDETALASAQQIIDKNEVLKGLVELRHQNRDKWIFRGVLTKEEYVDIVICNPPFHASQFEAETANLRKVKNLTGKKLSKPVLNFGGQRKELWCEGGEERFIADFARMSKEFANSCFWFTTLVSKESHVRDAIRAVKQAGANEFRILELGHGNKSSRILAWTFLSPKQQKLWAGFRWKNRS